LAEELDTPTLGWDARVGAAGSLRAAPATASALLASAAPARPRGWRDSPGAEDPFNIAVTGWAVVCLRSDREDAAEALAPLIAHRAARGEAWRGYDGELGLIAVDPPSPARPSSLAEQILERSTAPPRHLLLLGGPDRFPFEAQFDLDRDFVTGRLDCGLTAALDWEGCRRYARRVARYESGKLPTEGALLFSPQQDAPTRLSHDRLAAPLASHRAVADRSLRQLSGDLAHTTSLTEALQAARGPTLVFAASHGVEFPAEPSDWGAITGAGGGWVGAGALDPERPFASGSVIICPACFTAGVPARSAESFFRERARVAVPGGPFSAPLPRALLAHELGPVAFIGHVDRLTTASVAGSPRTPGARPFMDLLSWFLEEGQTLGRGMRSFREWYLLEAAAAAARTERTMLSGRPLSSRWEVWLRAADWRGYLLLGDPGLRRPTPGPLRQLWGRSRRLLGR